jgi:hypothetical protein
MRAKRGRVPETSGIAMGLDLISTGKHATRNRSTRRYCIFETADALLDVIKMQAHNN